MSSLESDVRHILNEKQQNIPTHSANDFIKLCEAQGASKADVESCLLDKMHMGAYSKSQRRFIQHCLSIVRKEVA